MPEKIKENVQELKTCDEYQKLVKCIAEWFTLMEMSEDLIERLKLYGISQYLDEKAMVQQLHHNWGAQADRDTSVGNTAAVAHGYFTGGLAYMFNAVSDQLFSMGIYAAATTTATRYAFGYAFIHPGYFVSALVSSAVVRMGAEQIQSQGVHTSITALTNHFEKVTQNLKCSYNQASETIAMSFIEKDQQKIHDSIDRLVKASDQKNHQGAMHIFDNKGEKFENLETEELDDDFVSINKN